MKSTDASWIVLAWLLATVHATAGASAAEAPVETPAVMARGAIQPQVAIDGDGNVYVVFIQGGNIAVSVSKDKGKTFSDPVVAIDLKGRASGGHQRGPRIGVDVKKNITVTAPVTFDDAEYAKKYPTADLYITTSSDGGKTWTNPLQVNEARKKAPESLHWMAVAPTGEAHVAWLDLRGRLEPGQDIYYATVSGGKVAKNVKIATEVCECCAPGLAVDAGGHPVVAWREGGKDKPSRELWITAARDRGRFTAPRRLNKAASNVFG